MSFSATELFKFTQGTTSLSGSASLIGNLDPGIDQTVAANSTNQLITFALTQNNLQGLFLLASQDTLLKTNSSGSPQDTIYLEAGVPLMWFTGRNTVQTWTMAGTPTGGTFSAPIITPGVGNSVGSGNLAYNISAATLQSTLAALANVGSGNVVCAGGPFPGTAITVSYQGALQSVFIPVPVFSNGSLTGGSTPAASGVITTGGGYQRCPFVGDVTAFYVTTGASSTQLQVMTISN